MQSEGKIKKPLLEVCFVLSFHVTDYWLSGSCNQVLSNLRKIHVIQQLKVRFKILQGKNCKDSHKMCLHKRFEQIIM